MSELKALMTGHPRLTLAVAESITSGRLQAHVGAISGASEFYLGGITAYTLDQKVRHLGVDPVEAASCNCVSARVAEQMARGVCVLFGSDVGAATTGYAEPSDEWGVSDPFACWAFAFRRRDGHFLVASGRGVFGGHTRTEVQERAASAALEALVRWIRETAAARRL